MLKEVTRSKPHQFLASTLSNHAKTFKFTTTTTTTMKQIKTKKPSTSPPDSSPLNPDSKCSSSVQSTPEIEKKYVHRVYDAIAPHFSATRFAKWPKVSTFLNNLRSGSVVLDAGCGNGKYLGLNPNCVFIGCDISAPLIQICNDRGHEVLVADAVNLPYRNEYGDAAISIAVLHHLSTEFRRKKAIDELIRVVKKGGLVLITVWAVEQEDRSLLNKWTPLSGKYLEEWIGPGSPRVRCSSPATLESIPETEISVFNQEVNDFGNVRQTEENCDLGVEIGDKNEPQISVSNEEVKIFGNVSQSEENCDLGVENGDKKEPQISISNQEVKDFGNVCQSEGNCDLGVENGDRREPQQEYFVPWHLPYHRAEVSGASAGAVENGLARKDDKKGAIVYDRYYHVFGEGELERLVSGIKNAVIVDQFYDKSNWCVILEKISC